MSDTLLIIPAYNEEESIEAVVEDLKKNYHDLDYVIVNDGSVDNTERICREKNYNTINLAVNLGLDGAFKAGMRYAYERGYEYAIQFDGDGQHKPEYIYDMRNRMRDGYDIVIASRFLHKRTGLNARYLGSRLIRYAIFFTTGNIISDPTSGMRMYSKKVIEEFALSLNYAPEPDTISYLIKQGVSVSEVSVTMEERKAGMSYLSPVNAVKYMIRILTSIFFIQNFRKREDKYRR